MINELEIYELIKKYRDVLDMFDKDESCSNVAAIDHFKDISFLITGIRSGGCKYCGIDAMTTVLKWTKLYETKNNIIYPYQEELINTELKTRGRPKKNI
jgi:hypothetical protein